MPSTSPRVPPRLHHEAVRRGSALRPALGVRSGSATSPTSHLSDPRRQRFPSRPAHRGCGSRPGPPARGGRSRSRAPRLPDSVRGVIGVNGQPETTHGSTFSLKISLSFCNSALPLRLGPSAYPTLETDSPKCATRLLHKATLAPALTRGLMRRRREGPSTRMHSCFRCS